MGRGIGPMLAGIALTALCWSGGTAAQTIVVGGKAFTEQQIMTAMTVALLKAKGFTPERKAGMITHSAAGVPPNCAGVQATAFVPAATDLTVPSGGMTGTISTIPIAVMTESSENTMSIIAIWIRTSRKPL